MRCLNTNCRHDFDASDDPKVSGYGNFIEVKVACPKCGQGHYSSIDADELILDPDHPAKEESEATA